MRIICFGAHPDDLEFGMGGTICKFVKKGYEVHLFISRECRGERFKEQENSNNILDIEEFRMGSFEFKDEMSEIEDLTNYIKERDPDVVYIPWMYDSNQHHRKLAKYVLSALRRTNISCFMYNSTTIKGITLQKFVPQIYEDISNVFPKKLKSISCHISQIKRYGKEYLDYVKNKDAHYGYEIGVKYAEVFQVMREVRK